MRTSRSRCKAFATVFSLCATFGYGGSIHRAPRLVSGALRDVADTLPRRFTLVSWNTHKERNQAFLADLGGLLDSSRADLLLLQEARVDAEPVALQAALGDRFWHLSANLAGDRTEYGVLTASKARTEATIALLSPTGEPVARTRKPALVTRYRIGGETLAVANVHALNFSPFLDGFRRQLLEVRDSLGTGNGPTIIAGDFNTWSQRKMRLADSLFATSGLISVEFGADDSKRTRVLGNAIDRIYYSPRFLVLDSTRVRVFDHVRTSDHVPLQAGFILKAETDSRSGNPSVP